MLNLIYSHDTKNNMYMSKPYKYHYSEDLKFFKKITEHTEYLNKTNAIIMGRTTADTLETPLVNRLNIVITSKDYNRHGFINYPTFEDAVQDINSEKVDRIFVIGGAKLLNYVIDRHFQSINHIYLTKINEEHKFDNYESAIVNHIPYHNCKRELIASHGKLSFNKYTNFICSESKYLSIMKNIMQTGDYRKTRNANTYSLFNDSITFHDVSREFPLLTTKKMFLRGIFEELKFFILGKTDTKELESKNVKIWSGNTNKDFLEKNKLDYKEGDMGPMYGFQWRHYGADYKGSSEDYTGKGFDQLSEVIELLNNDPNSRRILLTSYNASQSKEGVLYPCHGLTVQFYVTNFTLHCNMYQRSADWFLGCPFNIASYSLLLMIVARITKLKAGSLTISFGDMHIYEQHVECALEQLKRMPYNYPKLNINRKLDSIDDINNLEFGDIELVGYRFYPEIKASMVS